MPIVPSMPPGLPMSAKTGTTPNGNSEIMTNMELTMAYWRG
jgi:hypothetical protein